MADMQNGLPPGWGCKIDERTGKLYYINHYTKTTTWEDPSVRNRHLLHNPKYNQNPQTEYIQLQHGTPESRRNYVYPSQTSPLPAFQMPENMSPKSIILQEMSKPKISPLSVRSSKVQDSSLNITSERTDEMVAKVSAMFPTVPETHIRMLLRKYHSREALVISALQVEKYPITTPGPFSTPPPQRNIHQSLHATPPPGFRVNSRGGSPIYRPGSWGSPAGLRSSPRPHSSPKLKLRYMKSIFPQADEMVILDILQNNENNIQKASDSLKEMGFQKKDTVKIMQQNLKTQQDEELKEKENNVIAPPLPPRIKTLEDKQKVKIDLQEKYTDVAEHLICIALESVNFDEEKANQILQIMIQEDNKANTNAEESAAADIQNLPSTSSAGVSGDLTVSQSRQSLKSLLKAEKDLDKISFSRVVQNDTSLYKSPNISNTCGPNPEFAKGPNENLLLEDYVKWQGPNSAFTQGTRKLAKGPNTSLLSERMYKPRGPNINLIKGSQCGLVKGSIFSQFKAVVVGNSGGE